MRIAMFSNTFLPMVGGIENSVATFSEDFRKTGNECMVVTPEMDDAEESTREILRVPAIRNIGGSSFSLQMPVPGFLSSRMDDFAPDIVHAHHPFLMGDSALRCSGRLGIPLVLTYHTLWDRYADSFPCDKIKDIVVRLSVEYSNLCDCVVAPSRSLADMIASMGVTSPIEVIPTGIEISLFSSGSRMRGRRLLGLGDDVKLAAYVGRVGPEKNLAWLCGAAAKWCAADASARFAVVGPSEAYGPTLRGVFEKAGARDQLILPGAFRGRDLADVYAALDVFTFASLSDTQGIVLAEAMAAGLPIVALDAPGAREAVTGGANGFLLPAKATQEDYARSLADVFRDGARMSSMKESSKQRSASYDRVLTARRMLELYESLISNPVASEKRRRDGGLFEKLHGRFMAERKLMHARVSATRQVL
jgi:1,2-diacylglycerol 3-alpha-glucosyltransferase